MQLDFKKQLLLSGGAESHFKPLKNLTIDSTGDPKLECKHPHPHFSSKDSGGCFQMKLFIFSFSDAVLYLLKAEISMFSKVFFFNGMTRVALNCITQVKKWW